MRVEPCSHTRQYRGSNLENSAHLLIPNIQVPLVQEKLGTMSLLRDRELVQRWIIDSSRTSLDLPASRRTRIRLNQALKRDSRLYLRRKELVEEALFDS